MKTVRKEKKTLGLAYTIYAIKNSKDWIQAKNESVNLKTSHHPNQAPRRKYWEKNRTSMTCIKKCDLHVIGKIFEELLPKIFKLH